MTEAPVATDRGRDQHLQLRWDIWTRAFRFRLLPPRPVLHRLILERDALGTQLWDAVMRPALADRIPGLFTTGADLTMRRIAMDLRRVGASAYAVTGSLYLLHGSRPEAARAAGVAMRWTTLSPTSMPVCGTEPGCCWRRRGTGTGRPSGER